MPNHPSIVVIGSINMDIVSRVRTHPKPGETVKGWGTAYYPGGKGANQAAAAALAGANVQVRMLGAVGEDGFGEQLLASMAGFGIDTGYTLRKQGTSGLAFITVSEAGENNIILSEGANGLLTKEDISAAISGGLLDGAAAVLLQNEIPWEAGVSAMEAAAAQGVPVYLNPAPVREVPDDVLKLVSVLIVNETEAEALTGGRPTASSSSPVTVEEAERQAAALRGRGASEVIVTLGEQGAVYAGAEGVFHQPAFQVQAVDTTAAGDTFIGAYAARRVLGASAREALRAAAAASALAVTKPGAQSSIPAWAEIDDFLRRSPG